MADRDLVFTVLGVDKASRTFDNVGRSMDRMSSRATKALGGVTGAAGAASAAVAGSVAAASAAFIGLGAVALRNNSEVKASFQDLSDTVNEGLAQDAQPLADEFTGAADDIADSYAKLRPQMRAAFEASAPHVATLTSGVTGFAEQAMPGMVTAVESADPVMQGFRQLMIDAGAGTRGFFEIVSEGSDEAGQGIEHFGQLARDSLPEIGGILTNLTALWAEHGDEVVDVITRMLGLVEDLTSSMPTLSAGIGTALDVLQGLLGVIEPLSGQIGPLIGLWISLSAAMKGIRTVRGIVAGVTASVESFADASRRAGSARGVGALRGAATGMMGVLGGPWGVAVAGATAMLAAFGARSQQASQDQRKLADALRESGGEFDANARESLFNSESYQELTGTIDELGLSHERVLDALIEGGSALDELQSKIKSVTNAEGEQEDRVNAANAGFDKQASEASALSNRLGELRGQVQGATEDFRTEEDAIDTVGEEMAGSVPGADALTEAMKTLKTETASTEDRVDALNTAWRQLFGIELNLEEATANWEERLATLRETISGAKEDTASWRDEMLKANGQVDVTTEAGRKLSDQLVSQGEDYRRLAQTVFDTTKNRTGSEQAATQAVIEATSKRREQFISEAQQLGFNQQEAQQLADDYLGLPSEVLTSIQADASQFWSVVNSIPRVVKSVGVSITGFASSIGSAVGRADGGLVPGFAGGGQVPGFPHGGMLRGRGGPRSDSNLIAASDGEFIVNANSTSQNLDLLRGINSGRVSSADARAVMPSGGGRGGGGGTVTVRVVTDGVDEGLKEVIRNMVRVDGNGDVRVAFEP